MQLDLHHRSGCPLFKGMAIIALSMFMHLSGLTLCSSNFIEYAKIQSVTGSVRDKLILQTYCQEQRTYGDTGW